MRETRHLPELGARGQGWVAIQAVLIAAILLSALVGLGWSATLAPVAYAVGGMLLASASCCSSPARSGSARR